MIRSKFLRSSVGIGLDGDVRDGAVEGGRMVARCGVAGLPAVNWAVPELGGANKDGWGTDKDAWESGEDG